MKDTLRLSVIAVCIIILSLGLMGGCFNGDDDDEDDNPTGPSPDSTLMDVLYNGDWVYIDLHNSSQEIPLEDSLFMEDDTDWAHIQFVDFEDTSLVDRWKYWERTDEGDILLLIEGKMEETSGAMFMSYEVGYNDWVHFFAFNFGQSADTLVLYDAYDPNNYYRLVAWEDYEQ